MEKVLMASIVNHTTWLLHTSRTFFCKIFTIPSMLKGSRFVLLPLFSALSVQHEDLLYNVEDAWVLK